MASRKKSDGGAARAAGRKRVRNKRQEAKYGLQGFTAQANRNLNAPGRYLPTTQQTGMGIIEASGFGNASSIAQATVRASRAVASSGIRGRIINKVTRSEVLLHGRGTAGYRQIKPAGGKVENNPELQKYAYSWYDNPKVNPSGDIAQTYAGNTGTVYAVRGKRNTFINDANRSAPPNFSKDPVIASQKNQKVVGSVNMTGLTAEQRAAEIAKMLKKAGVKVPKTKGSAKRK